MKSATYAPHIDGLRAMAVLAVIGFHYFPIRIQGGFVGVDIFFVTYMDSPNASNHILYFKNSNNQKSYLHTSDDTKKAISFLEKKIVELLAAHKKVFLVLDNPKNKLFNPKHHLGSRFVFPFQIKPMPATDYSQQQINLRNELITMAKRLNIMLIDPIPTLCPANQCLIAQPGSIPIYKDDNHLTSTYAKKYAHFIDATVKV